MEELGHVIVKGIPKWLLFSIFTRVINLKLLLLHIQLSSTPSSLSNGKDKLEMFDLPSGMSFFHFFFLISGPVATKHRPEVLQHFNGNDRTERKPYPNKDYPGMWYIYISFKLHEAQQTFLVQKAFLFAIPSPLRGKNSLKYCFPNDLRLSPW